MRYLFGNSIYLNGPCFLVFFSKTTVLNETKIFKHTKIKNALIDEVSTRIWKNFWSNSQHFDPDPLSETKCMQTMRQNIWSKLLW